MKTMMLGYIEESPSVTETYLTSPLDAAAQRIVALLKSNQPFVLTGCGTSYHMALLGARLFTSLAGTDARALPSFDLAWYTPEVVKGKVLVVISHSGASKATLDAVAQARLHEPALVVGISAHAETPLAKLCDVHLAMPGGWEKALPKTRIYTAGSFQLMHLAAVAGGREGSVLPEPAALRQAMEQALEANRATIDEVAEKWRDYQIYSFIGGGAAWVTACEAALKFRENNYTFAEGYEVEELSHGRTAAFEPDRPVVGIALKGPSMERLSDMMATARYLKVPTMVVAEEGAPGVPEADYTLRIPAMPSELAAAVIAALPLQLLSHQITVARGVNPDSIRLDDPERAYVENRWIFPPGTH